MGSEGRLLELGFGMHTYGFLSQHRAWSITHVLSSAEDNKSAITNPIHAHLHNSLQSMVQLISLRSCSAKCGIEAIVVLLAHVRWPLEFWGLPRNPKCSNQPTNLHLQPTWMIFSAPAKHFEGLSISGSIQLAILVAKTWKSDWWDHCYVFL